MLQAALGWEWGAGAGSILPVHLGVGLGRGWGGWQEPGRTCGLAECAAPSARAS